MSKNRRKNQRLKFEKSDRHITMHAHHQIRGAMFDQCRLKKSVSICRVISKSIGNAHISILRCRLQNNDFSHNWKAKKKKIKKRSFCHVKSRYIFTLFQVLKKNVVKLTDFLAIHCLKWRRNWFRKSTIYQIQRFAFFDKMRFSVIFDIQWKTWQTSQIFQRLTNKISVRNSVWKKLLIRSVSFRRWRIFFRKFTTKSCQKQNNFYVIRSIEISEKAEFFVDRLNAVDRKQFVTKYSVFSSKFCYKRKQHCSKWRSKCARHWYQQSLFQRRVSELYVQWWMFSLFWKFCW